MSKQKNAKDRKDIKQYYNIAKICFYIMVFNIVVRLDLWISIAGMIIILPYLLNRLLLKKIDISTYFSMCSHYINSIKNARQEPTKEQEQVVKSTLKSEAHDPNELLPMHNFVETSFEEIWRDCPKNDLVWDENNQQEEDREH